MSDAPYAKEIAYLSAKANNGSLTRDDNIYQWLLAKRNIGSVASFLDSIESRIR